MRGELKWYPPDSANIYTESGKLFAEGRPRDGVADVGDLVSRIGPLGDVAHESTAGRAGIFVPNLAARQHKLLLELETREGIQNCRTAIKAAAGSDAVRTKLEVKPPCCATGT